MKMRRDDRGETHIRGSHDAVAQDGPSAAPSHWDAEGETENRGVKWIKEDCGCTDDDRRQGQMTALKSYPDRCQ